RGSGVLCPADYGSKRSPDLLFLQRAVKSADQRAAYRPSGLWCGGHVPVSLSPEPATWFAANSTHRADPDGRRKLSAACARTPTHNSTPGARHHGFELAGIRRRIAAPGGIRNWYVRFWDRVQPEAETQ